MTDQPNDTPQPKKRGRISDVETPAALQAFEDYWSLGNGRSIVKLVEHRQKVGKNSVNFSATKRLFEKWSDKFNWQERIKARIQEQADQIRAKEQEALLARRAKVQEDDWELAEQLREKARKMLTIPVVEQKLEKEVTDAEGRVIKQTYIIQPVKWSLATLTSVVKTSSDMARLATGLPNQHIKNDHTFGTMTDEELREFIKRAFTSPGGSNNAGR